MVLCDPVQRAQSAFYHFKSWGARFRQFVRRNAHMYGPMLDSWLAVVGDIMVVPSASYFKEPCTGVSVKPFFDIYSTSVISDQCLARSSVQRYAHIISRPPTFPRPLCGQC